ncbi:hypothetical protein WN51_03088 [Melipona quadrifasciata]|uniref:Uncharacterized protein n=1 Tax=Melipona quadrifasciata TaxID=166423 RepID=A0A0M8ZWF3_9HYME|nr:hypothetical protein WN51_03088 [Melipona quadrifasciata]
MSPKMPSLFKRTAKAKAEALPWDYYVILQDSPVAGRISSLPSEDFVEDSIPFLNQTTGTCPWCHLNHPPMRLHKQSSSTRLKITYCRVFRYVKSHSPNFQTNVSKITQRICTHQGSMLINRPHNTVSRGQICGVEAYLKPADPRTETMLGQGTLMKTIRPWIKVATGQLSVLLGTTCLMQPWGRPYGNQRIRWKFRALIPNIMPPTVNPLLVILPGDLAPYITEH